jgi:hypothetical protein
MPNGWYIAAALVATPIMVFLVVKFATFGYYRGRRMAEKYERDFDKNK